MKCVACPSTYKVQIVKLVNNSFAALCIGHRQRHAGLIAEHQPILGGVMGMLAHREAKAAGLELTTVAVDEAQGPIPEVELDGLPRGEWVNVALPTPATHPIPAIELPHVEAGIEPDYAGVAFEAGEVPGPDSFGGTDAESHLDNSANRMSWPPTCLYQTSHGKEGAACGKCFLCDCPF